MDSWESAALAHNGGMQTLVRALAHGLLAGTCLAAATAHAEPVRYTLDAHHSWVQFELMHFGTSTIRGRLGPAQGTVTLDRAAGTAEVAIEVPTASVSTGLGLFDARIRKADLLATDEHPRAWFIGRQSRFDDAGQLAEVRGELSLRGRSQPVTLKATRFGCYQHPRLQREVCGGDFEGEIRRSDFDMSFGLPFVDNLVHLKVQAEGVRAE